MVKTGFIDEPAKRRLVKSIEFDALLQCIGQSAPGLYAPGQLALRLDRSTCCRLRQLLLLCLQLNRLPAQSREVGVDAVYQLGRRNDAECPRCGPHRVVAASGQFEHVLCDGGDTNTVTGLERPTRKVQVVLGIDPGMVTAHAQEFGRLPLPVRRRIGHCRFKRKPAHSDIVLRNCLERDLSRGQDRLIGRRQRHRRRRRTILDHLEAPLPLGQTGKAMFIGKLDSRLHGLVHTKGNDYLHRTLQRHSRCRSAWPTQIYRRVFDMVG